MGNAQYYDQLIAQGTPQDQAAILAGFMPGQLPPEQRPETPADVYLDSTTGEFTRGTEAQQAARQSQAQPNANLGAAAPVSPDYKPPAAPAAPAVTEYIPRPERPALGDFDKPTLVMPTRLNPNEGFQSVVTDYAKQHPSAVVRIGDYYYRPVVSIEQEREFKAEGLNTDQMYARIIQGILRGELAYGNLQSPVGQFVEAGQPVLPKPTGWYSDIRLRQQWAEYEKELDAKANEIAAQKAELLADVEKGLFPGKSHAEVEKLKGEGNTRLLGDAWQNLEPAVAYELSKKIQQAQYIELQNALIQALKEQGHYKYYENRPGAEVDAAVQAEAAAIVKGKALPVTFTATGVYYNLDAILKSKSLTAAYLAKFPGEKAAVNRIQEEIAEAGKYKVLPDGQGIPLASVKDKNGKTISLGWNDLDAKYRRIGESQGAAAMLAAMEADVVKLSTGEYINKSDYDGLTAAQQRDIVTLGIDRFNTKYGEAATGRAAYWRNIAETDPEYLKKANPDAYNVLELKGEAAFEDYLSLIAKREAAQGESHQLASKIKFAQLQAVDSVSKWYKDVEKAAKTDGVNLKNISPAEYQDFMTRHPELVERMTGYIYNPKDMSAANPAMAAAVMAGITVAAAEPTPVGEAVVGAFGLAAVITALLTGSSKKAIAIPRSTQVQAQQIVEDFQAANGRPMTADDIKIVGASGQVITARDLPAIKVKTTEGISGVGAAAGTATVTAGAVTDFVPVENQGSQISGVPAVQRDEWQPGVKVPSAERMADVGKGTETPITEPAAATSEGVTKISPEKGEKWLPNFRRPMVYIPGVGWVPKLARTYAERMASGEWTAADRWNVAAAQRQYIQTIENNMREIAAKQGVPAAALPKLKTIPINYDKILEEAQLNASIEGIVRRARSRAEISDIVRKAMYEARKSKAYTEYQKAVAISSRSPMRVSDMQGAVAVTIETVQDAAARSLSQGQTAQQAALQARRAAQNKLDAMLRQQQQAGVQTLTKTKLQNLINTMTTTKAITQTQTQTKTQTQTRTQTKTGTRALTRTMTQTQPLARTIPDVAETDIPKVPRLKSSEKSKTTESPETLAGGSGKTAWPQGMGWWTREQLPNGRIRERFIMGQKPPAGFKQVQPGPGEAYRGIQTVGGGPGNFEKRMGAVKVRVQSPRSEPGAAGAISFKSAKGVKIIEIKGSTASRPKPPRRGRRGVIKDLGGDIIITRRGPHLRL